MWLEEFLAEEKEVNGVKDEPAEASAEAMLPRQKPPRQV